jgi:hypothetical protein
MDSNESYDAAIRDLTAANVTAESAGSALRQMDYVTEAQRRELVGWLDDLQVTLQRTGQVFQRLNERSAARSPLAGMNGGGEQPTVIVHEQGEGPRPR